MHNTRRLIVFFIFITLLFSLFFRLFYLQVFCYEKFHNMALGQHNQVLKIEPRRGTIYDRFMEPLAINLDVTSVYADPRSIEDKNYTAEVLTQKLSLEYESVRKKLDKDKAFVWIKRKIDPDLAEELSEMGIPGVHFLPESKRKYSNDNMACHVLGFVGIDNDGLEGIELLLDERLKGTPGWRHLIRDAKRRTVLLNQAESIPPQNGYNIVLTIDSVIQYIVEDEIGRMARKHNAESAMCIVMEPYSGRVLAMANYPDYNLNESYRSDRNVRKNLAVTDIFEPGSVFKIISAGAVLEEGVKDLDDVVHCENGEYEVARRVLHDYHAYDEITFKEVIAYSSNIGTVKAAMELGKDKFYKYLKDFGFGEKTGIDIMGEVSGISRHPRVWSRSDITTIPIGQGIAVTALQMAAATSAIANGGYLMKPFIIEKITSWEGNTFKEFSPEIKREILSQETCDKIKEAMHMVVTDGTGKRANSKLFKVCGKTGTAQMVDPEGGYFDNKYYATFVGFAPMDKPVLAVVVAARDPHPVYFGGSVAGPAFKGIVERSLQYLANNGTAPITGKE